MAQVKDNLITEGASGKLGRRLVFRHMKDGRTIIATRPDYSGHEWTPDQQAHHSRFQQAAAYARVACRTNPLYAEFARGTAKNAYNLALSDWFKAPVIHAVTRQAGRISVHVTDNVHVAKVIVTILDEQGQTLEKGEAVPLQDGWWEYNLEGRREENILIEAFDLAGNVTERRA